MAYSEQDMSKAKTVIVDGIIEGKSLVKVIKENKDSTPSIRTVFNWLNPESDYHDKEFLHNYALAQQIRAEREFEEIIDIADDQEGDVYIDADGIERINHNVINRSRLRVDARKWRLAKMQPKKYGDRIQHANDPESPMPMINVSLDGKALSLSTDD